MSDRTRSALGERLQTVRVSEPLEAGGLQVFALSWEAPGGVDYRTLDEAVAAEALEVSEVSSGGSVPNLKVLNKDGLPVFLMAGEHLAGGKQNRVLNASILIAGNSEVHIPVSCVERGRWAYRAPTFQGSGSSSHSALRRMMHTQVTQSYRTLGKASSNQTEVWREVERKLAETCSDSATHYLEKAYEDTEPVLREVAEKLGVPEGASGAVFAYGGRIVGFDLFDRPTTLAHLWTKLVRAYAIDAWIRKGEKEVTTDGIRTWLAAAVEAKEEVFKSPGMGDDVRLESGQLVAACLRVGDQPIHVEAFAQAS